MPGRHGLGRAIMLKLNGPRYLFPRLFSSSAVNFNLPGPESTDYYNLDTKDSFGSGRVQSTRLQAASRRIAEHFIIYDTMEQALLEHEATLNFGDVESRAPVSFSNDAVVTSQTPSDQVDSEGITAAKDYLFHNYSIPNSENLEPYVHDMETVPAGQSGEESRQQVLRKLRNLLKSTQPRFLNELAGFIMKRDSLDPTLTGPILEELMKRGYYMPAQVILDSLVMSRLYLGSQVLSQVLYLATRSGNEALFHNYARLYPFPAPTMIDMSNTTYKPRPARDFIPDRDVGMSARFFAYNEHTQKFAPLDGTAAQALFQVMAQGYLKFRDPQRLDRVMAWAKNERVLNQKLAMTNLLASRNWNDEKRASWTWSYVKKHFEKLDPSLAELAAKLNLKH